MEAPGVVVSPCPSPYKRRLSQRRTPFSAHLPRAVVQVVVVEAHRLAALWLHRSQQPPQLRLRLRRRVRIVLR